MGSSTRRGGMIGGVPAFYRKKQRVERKQVGLPKEHESAEGGVADHIVINDDFEEPEDLSVPVELELHEDYSDSLEYEELEEHIGCVKGPKRMRKHLYVFSVDKRYGKSPIEVF